ncbi:unnamed protein product [Rhizophagus irregularis]|uniref:18S rRNA factor 2 n=3 Tax=Rhizophagus irregularis TaxID=588596 RepID=A0A2N1NB69_9GLOM|nr:Esf2p [Rhizophagus irregularis DAOM 197198w]PKK71153.1 hypothetical protein RhiirC2_745156 [Rhizophagus irregularis]GBC51698.1 pre-rRNA-processing protein esf2-like [Rhizophagus irregularis DAOM 181602=DAOM 197198]UZO27429.1 hypothetical protein OCT59_019625 [Rhizophagus irregularis]CAB4392260.1 unnamed protein product [Rhizophagus irregularis]
MSEFSEDKEKNIIEITTNKEQEAVKPLTPAKLEKFKKAQDNTGIIYLSSIPPFMKPSKVKHLLGQFGNIGRVYLAPEDPKTRIRRKKYGGNKKKKYTEGWIEFLDKRIAKTVANTLNARPIGGNKRNYYHDDLWNIKYLPKFKWTNLTDQIVHEKATRIQRLQAEISQARRENKEYLKKVEKAKMIKSMEEKKEKKRKVAEVEESNLETFTEADTREKKKKKVKEFQSDNKSFEDDDNSQKYSKFKQRKLVISEVIEGRKNDEPTNTSEGVKKILSKIFMK